MSNRDRIGDLERAVAANTRTLQQLVAAVEQLTQQRDRAAGAGTARAPDPAPVHLHTPDDDERARVRAANAAWHAERNGTTD